MLLWVNVYGECYIYSMANVCLPNIKAKWMGHSGVAFAKYAHNVSQTKKYIYKETSVESSPLSKHQRMKTCVCFVICISLLKKSHRGNALLARDFTTNRGSLLSEIVVKLFHLLN